MSIPAVHWALSQRTGSSSRKAVLKCIAEWMIGEKAVDCYPTVEQIAFETELNRKTVMDATRALEKAGFIKKRRACNKKLQWETHYTLVGYEPSEWIGSRRPECRTFENPNVPKPEGTKNGTFEGTKTGTSVSPKNGTYEGTKNGTRTRIDKEDMESTRISMRTSGNSSAIAAVASAQAKMPYPDDFDKSLFDEAEREARSFPEPLPEPPALPPVEQPASTPARPKMAYPPCQYDKVVELYHANCKGLRRVMALTDARKRTINARWREFCKEDDLKTTAEALESFEWYFQEVSKSRFLMGYSTPGPGRDRPFKADFDWLMCPTNFLKVCEGKYSNGPKN